MSQVVASRQREVTRRKRWINHYGNRIAYELAMLAEQGGLKADAFDLVVGGQVLVRGEWVTILRINRVQGKINSVSTNARFVSVRHVEGIKDYRAPSADVAAKVKAIKTLPPLCNYPDDGFESMTKAQFAGIHVDYKGSRELGQGAQRPDGYRPDIKGAAVSSTAHGRHRVRSVIVARGGLAGVFLTDVKRTDPPAPEALAEEPLVLTVEPVLAVSLHTLPPKSESAAEFEAIRNALKTGIQVVSAPQLFPTPAALAARMVDLAQLKPGDRVFEPSAGTGRILGAIRDCCRVMAGEVVVTAIEIDRRLADHLIVSQGFVEVLCGDFLACGQLGPFDAILFNPPFTNGQDIAHIQRALTTLAPGRRLVAICADGPRQGALLRPLVDACGGDWERLSADSFKEAGTAVSTVMLTITA